MKLAVCRKIQFGGPSLVGHGVRILNHIDFRIYCVFRWPAVTLMRAVVLRTCIFLQQSVQDCVQCVRCWLEFVLAAH